jgi:MFS family permease
MVAPGGDTAPHHAVVAYMIVLSFGCVFVGLLAWKDHRRRTVALAWLVGVLLAGSVLILWMAAALYVGYDVGTKTTPMYSEKHSLASGSYVAFAGVLAGLAAPLLLWRSRTRHLSEGL